MEAEFSVFKLLKIKTSLQIHTVPTKAYYLYNKVFYKAVSSADEVKDVDEAIMHRANFHSPLISILS